MSFILANIILLCILNPTTTTADMLWYDLLDDNVIFL